MAASRRQLTTPHSEPGGHDVNFSHVHRQSFTEKIQCPLYSTSIAQTHMEESKVTTANMLKSLLAAALLASAASYAAADIATENGKATQFKIGDSDCTLVDGQLRCTWSK